MMHSSPGRSAAPHVRFVALAVLAAIAVRGIALTQRHMISRDAVNYVWAMQAYDRGEPYEGWHMAAFPRAVWAVRSLTGLDWQACGHLVVIVFSGLVMIPLYALALHAGGIQCARLSLALYAVHPELVHAATDVIGYPMASFFLLAALGLAWIALKRGALWAAVLAPACGLVATATRREAVAVLLAMAVVAPLLLFSSALPRYRNRFGAAYRFVLCGPLGALAVLAAVYSLAPDVWSSLSDLLHRGREKVTLLDHSPAETSGRFLWGLQAATAALIRAVTWGGFPLLLIGAWVGRRRLKDGLFRALFVSVCTAAFLLLPARTIGEHIPGVAKRYFFVVMPLLLMLCAFAILRLREEVANRWGKRWAAVTVPAFLVLGFAFSLRSPDSNRAGYLRAAEYIRAEFGPGRRIASTRNQIAYYAGGRHFPIPDRPEAIRRIPVDFVVLRPSSLERTRGPGFLRKLIEARNLHELRAFEGGIRVYRAGSTPSRSRASPGRGSRARPSRPTEMTRVAPGGADSVIQGTGRMKGTSGRPLTVGWAISARPIFCLTRRGNMVIWI